MNTGTAKKNTAGKHTHHVRVTDSYPMLLSNKDRASALRRTVGSWRTARLEEITRDLNIQRERDEQSSNTRKA